MGAFFEKLRTDRQFIEARKICEEIKSETIKDHLKTILVLHYSGLQSTGMLDVLAGIEPLNHKITASELQEHRKGILLRPREKKSKATTPPATPPDGSEPTAAAPAVMPNMERKK
jgi:hypothetical protein